MHTTILGRTGRTVSVMGLGCGGHSRLGLATGGDTGGAIAVVRRALERGVDFIDTAESYGTEEAVGLALDGVARESVTLSTKVGARRDNHLLSAAEFIERTEGCLRRLKTDCIDLMNVHGVAPDDYAHVRDELIPALESLQAAGKVRFLGITEVFGNDTEHRMLEKALADDAWDVYMVGFNLLNPSARGRVLEYTLARSIGVQCMFAVRRALSRPDALKALVDDLISRGLVDPAEVDRDDPLGFLTRDGIAADIPEAAYRFCRHEPGIHVVLSGTGNPAHVDQNALSINGAPLPSAVLEKLERLFGRIDCVSGN